MRLFQCSWHVFWHVIYVKPFCFDYFIRIYPDFSGIVVTNPYEVYYIYLIAIRISMKLIFSEYTLNTESFIFTILHIHKTINPHHFRNRRFLSVYFLVTYPVIQCHCAKSFNFEIIKKQPRIYTNRLRRHEYSMISK
jgi:hypothetical protein